MIAYIFQNMWSHEVPFCPICLDTPCAARITKCGHIYCWPCILHYLELDHRSWRKCPICHEAIHKSDLKRYDANFCFLGLVQLIFEF